MSVRPQVRLGARPRCSPTRTRRGVGGNWGWLVFLLAAVAILSGFLVRGVTRNELGHEGAGQGAASRGGSAGLRPTELGVGFDGDRPVAMSVPRKTVALTFDDGPDPRWTPRVLSVLRRQGVPATFFLIGAKAISAPSLVRQELAEGHEVGNHTFTHVDLATAPAWRRRAELSLAEAALAGSGGVTSSLLRPPYSSGPNAMSRGALAALQDTGGGRYVVVLANRDSRDWERPGVATIVDRATPRDGGGAIIMFHDGGGDRSETIQAVDRLIPLLRSQGYRFTTVGDALGLRSGAEQPATPAQRLQGAAMVFAVSAANKLVWLLALLLLPASLLAFIRLLISSIYAWRHAQAAHAHGYDPTWTPPVTVVVPAYNEAAGIAAAVTSLAASDYPELEVLVIDDGSTDGTADIVRGLGLPNVRVISKVNGGKAAALNWGIAEAGADIVVMVDGDVVFRPDTVRWLVHPLKNSSVGAVSGQSKVGNHGWLPMMQHIEYIIGFNLDRRMLDTLDAIPTVPGAVGAFRRTALASVGGVSTTTLAEDTDLTMAVNLAGWRVVYEERAVAYTEVPHTLRTLWRQRYRWSYGTMQAMWRHKARVLEPVGEHRGHVGRFGLPYLLVFQIILPLLAPLFDLWALYGVVFLGSKVVGWAWLVFMGVQALSAVYAFRLDGEPLWPLLALPLQQLIYRQILYLVVLQSLVCALRGSRLPWQRLDKQGTAAEVMSTVAQT